MFADDELADRAAAGLHAHWRLQCAYIGSGEVAENAGVLVTATRLADPTLNVAFAPGPVDDAAAALAWTEEWFRSRGLDPGLEVRVGRVPALDALLAERGYRVAVRRPAMTLHPFDPPAGTAPRCSVRRVTDDGDLAAFRAVQADAFDLAPDVVSRFLPSRALETPGIAFFLAVHDDLPCATAAASISPHGAGIVGVATLPEHRRRGIGRSVTAAALRWAADQGSDVAWLYPTPVARSLYESLGFRAVDDTQVWVTR